MYGGVGGGIRDGWLKEEIDNSIPGETGNVKAHLQDLPMEQGVIRLSGHQVIGTVCIPGAHSSGAHSSLNHCRLCLAALPSHPERTPVPSP